jgi:hypothetical protein
VTRQTLTRCVLWALAIGYSFFLGGHLFEMIALVPNWRSGSPVDVARYRDFLSQSGPGAFFQIILIPTLIAAIVSAILVWPKRSLRGGALIPIVVIVLYGVWTTMYFVPINAYIGQPTYEPERLKVLVSGWVFWEMVRAGLVSVGLVGAVWLFERSRQV